MLDDGPASNEADAGDQPFDNSHLRFRSSQEQALGGLNDAAACQRRKEEDLHARATLFPLAVSADGKGEQAGEGESGGMRDEPCHAEGVEEVNNLVH